MPVAPAKPRRESGSARATLRARLEARREEIEVAAATRVSAIEDPDTVSDPTYAESLQAAVRTALAYGLETLECDEGQEPPIPVELLAQAHLAARNGISLDTVLRRYFAGYSLLGFFLIEEASRDGLMDPLDLQRLVVTRAGTFDRLIAAIGEAHAREIELSGSALGDRQAERIERLLEGELLDTSDISYDFDRWHLGLALVERMAAEPLLRDLTLLLDCRLLTLPGAEGTLWAWLGSRRRLETSAALDALASCDGVESPIAVGEPGEGLLGWRLTHRQAAAALALAKRGTESFVTYGDVALMASVAQDSLLTASLRAMYLTPLEGERDGGERLRRTLRSYFTANRNVSSAAAELGVSRRTVSNRLQRVEELIGPIHRSLAELETALRLDILDRSVGSQDGTKYRA